MKPLDRCKPPAAQLRRSAGFTLIELLVALTILAVVALLAWRGLDQVARGRDTLARVTENERALSQLYDQMHSDIQQAARDDEISAPPLRIAQHSLEIVRELRLPGQTTRLEVIRYQLQDGHVLRYASPALVTVGQLRSAAAPDADVADWSTVDLVEGVTDFSTRLYLPRTGWVDNNSNAQRTFNANLKALSQPVAGGGPMPRSITGVEFKMHVLGQQGPLTRVFLVGE
jgi:general secretion pathway protein J